MTVRLHIERLVVEGLELSAADGAHLQGAIAEELSARLASADPAQWTGFSVPALAVGPIAIGEGAGPDLLGRSAGAALHQGLLR